MDNAQHTPSIGTRSKLALLTIVFASGLIAPTNLAAQDEPVISINGVGFYTWQDYASSALFEATGARCGTLDREDRQLFLPPAAESAPSDCSASSTNPLPIYDPGLLYTIDVVVHVIMNTSGSQGAISDALVQSQIDILNEDFLALMGTNGANGTDLQFQFQLAALDPDGDPTSGITRSNNDTWFDDNGSYWNALAWDPTRYLNIYTNKAGGALGYVPFLPADGGGGPGSAADRVVILWSTFGRDAPFGPPYDQGRTVTHELGHYFGLEHTFNGSCANGSSPACYGNGDLICDTNPEGESTGGCPASKSSCGSPDPISNYMDYSDDLCMEDFTLEQTRRIRCSRENYRVGIGSPSSSTHIFSDGFETGDTSAWSVVFP